MKVITIATGNDNKVREISVKLADSGITIIPMSVLKSLPDIEENGSTFLENAIIKAQAISRLFSTAVLADDSGLVVDALNGEPGIYSARYLGLSNDKERYEALLEKMKEIPVEKRTARFICAIAFITPEGTLHTAEESCEGIISQSPSGAGGFGYDPVFYLPQFNKTMAEISIEEKNVISHRGKAIDRICKVVQQWIKN